MEQEPSWLELTAMRDAARASTLGRLSMQMQHQRKGGFSLEARLNPQNVTLFPRWQSILLEAGAHWSWAVRQKGSCNLPSCLCYWRASPVVWGSCGAISQIFSSCFHSWRQNAWVGQLLAWVCRVFLMFFFSICCSSFFPSSSHKWTGSFGCETALGPQNWSAGVTAAGMSPSRPYKPLAGKIHELTASVTKICHMSKALGLSPRFCPHLGSPAGQYILHSIMKLQVQVFSVGQK